MNKKHIFFWKLLRPLLIMFLWLKFGYRYKKAKNLPDNYIVLSNHTTDFDPIFVGASFPKQMYFVASEHIARWKNAFRFLNFIFAPIMRYKGTVASATVVEVLRKVKKGANVCIFAEGARSWDGVSSPILSSTGKLVKSSDCGLVTYKIIGGYFASPMWSGMNTRRGPVFGTPVNVYTKEQLAVMSVDEINDVIKKDLYEDAYERQLADPKKYTGKRLAEQMETLLFICPQCGKIDTMHSRDDTVSCDSCGLIFHYDEYGMLSGLPFKTVRELAAWQKEEVKRGIENATTYSAESATLSTITKHQETLLAQGKLTLSSEVLRCGDVEIAIKDISDMAMHGKQALVFSVNKTYYELIPSKEFNALKFLWFFDGCKNQ